MSAEESRALKKVQDEVIALHEALTIMGRQFADLRAMYDALNKKFDALSATHSGDPTDGAAASHDVEMAELRRTVGDLAMKVDGRNKSAPVKRNMTDADAHRVLDGDLKEMDHKAAAEAAGLTYAQVYSARGGFTFKHVLSELSKKGWKNPWEKPKGAHRMK